MDNQDTFEDCAEHDGEFRIEDLKAITAELRAARECVAVLREYQWGGDTEWCDACKCHEGRHNSDCAIEGALLAYDAAVKGDG